MNNLHIPDELIHAITAIKSRQPILIAIDGCGGAGKSTYAALLAKALKNSQIVHIDDFYKPKEQRVEVTEQTSVHINFEFDRLKTQVLEPLKQGTAPSYQTPKGEDRRVDPKGYVIVEGLGTLGPELKDYFDYKIWIDSLEATRRERGVKRDSEDWAKIWDEEYLPQDARYMQEQLPQNQADWTLSNS